MIVDQHAANSLSQLHAFSSHPSDNITFSRSISQYQFHLLDGSPTLELLNEKDCAAQI